MEPESAKKGKKDQKMDIDEGEGAVR
jgi:hypothetical protein